MLEKGVRVRVLGGPFTGRVGVISELDGKGGARVTLGLLSAWVPSTISELSARRRVRPALKSSHRKPSPASGADDVRSEATRSRKTRPQKRSRRQIGRSAPMKSPPHTAPSRSPVPVGLAAQVRRHFRPYALGTLLLAVYQTLPTASIGG